MEIEGKTILWIALASAGVLITVLTYFFTVGKWVGNVNTDRSNFKEFMGEVREDIKNTREDIKNILSRLPPHNPLSTSSPIHLTELGESISESTDAKTWAIGAAEELHERIEGKDAFEIQQFSFDYANEFVPDEDLLKKMHSSAFETGLALEKIRGVFGVELRDRLFKLIGMKVSGPEKS